MSKKNMGFFGVLSFFLAGMSSSFGATLSLPASAHGDSYSCSYSFSYQYLYTSAGTCSTTFPIRLPAGTYVSSVKVYYLDDSSTYAVSASLVRQYLPTGGLDSPSYVSSSGSSSSVRYLLLPGFPVISPFGYYISIASGAGLRIYGVEINY